MGFVVDITIPGAKETYQSFTSIVQAHENKCPLFEFPSFLLSINLKQPMHSQSALKELLSLFFARPCGAENGGMFVNLIMSLFKSDVFALMLG